MFILSDIWIRLAFALAIAGRKGSVRHYSLLILLSLDYPEYILRVTEV